jgi:hypothetical protein
VVSKSLQLYCAFPFDLDGKLMRTIIAGFADLGMTHRQGGFEQL